MEKKVYDIKDIDDYRDRLTSEQAKVLVKHYNSYGIYPVICAWYDNMDDFYQDWIHDNHVFETKEDTDYRYQVSLKNGEFLEFANGEIVRLVI